MLMRKQETTMGTAPSADPVIQLQRLERSRVMSSNVGPSVAQGAGTLFVGMRRTWSRTLKSGLVRVHMTGPSLPGVSPARLKLTVEPATAKRIVAGKTYTIEVPNP